jgi:membrane-bound lytic murein transglycosylase D
MSLVKSSALVICLAGAAVGCATRQAPVAAPAPASDPTPIPVVEHAPPPAPAIDRITLIVTRAETEFELGRAEFDRGHLVAARAHFDRAVETLIQQPEGARGDRRLQAAYERLVDRIAALELRALREADGITEARTEPAAIDEVLTAAMFERPTPKATTAETVAADLEHTPRSIPIDMNPKVLSYVELYQGRLREFLQAGLNRGQRYLPMIHKVFEEEGVPVDLAFIPLVESAFKSTAVSRVSARGMWQFMLPTAKEQGLRQTWFVDERSDPEKATRAAAQYLKTLHRMFDGNWNLALASYNAGPGRLQRAIRQGKSEDFWKLTATTRYLPRETREYVPMIQAAAIIARSPELYGFDIVSAAPLAYETIEVSGALDLKLIAEWAELSVEDLQDLNPELRRTTTPMTAHALKVPVGTGAAIQAGLQSAEPLFRTFRFHTVKRGETVSGIARKYGISTRAVRDANNLSAAARISVRQELAIPAPSATALPAAGGSRPTAVAAKTGATETYRVRSGDTLIGIARQFGTTVPTLKRLNGLASDRIRAGDRLRVPR